MSQVSAHNLQPENVEKIAAHIKEIITLLGEDPGREGLVKTPLRAAKALAYITSGYRQNVAETLESALFEHSGSNIVVVKDIEFYSMCEHHILPFFGRVSVAYIPNGKIVGLSKIARAVDICARKLQIQERLTAEICRAVTAALGSDGVLVKCEAQHLCMKMRGVEKQDSSTVTVETSGKFSTDSALLNHAMTLLD